MKSFEVRDRIINHVQSGDDVLHIFCIVQSVREDGLLVVRNERYGNWIADPDKCQLFSDPHIW